jgi:glycosyltransferase involved in cell wall biosynthesis
VVGREAVRVAINAQLVSFGASYRNAGISRYTYQLLDGLGRIPTDLEFTAFINGAERQDAAKSEVGQVSRVRLIADKANASGPLGRITWEQFALPGELKRMGADVFHAPANALPRSVPCASVLTILDLAFLRYPQFFRRSRRMYQRILTRRSAHRATRIVAISESTRRDVVELFGIASDKIAVIYPSIAPDFQPVDSDAIQRFRADKGLPDQYLLYLGTIEPRKNLETLVIAYARFRSLMGVQAPPLILAGAKGWYYESLFQRVRDLGIERDVTFVGYVSREEQPLWYAGAALFVYPSLYEGFGMPIVEALGCGTPTITANTSSMPEAAGTLARLVAPNDDEALATTMYHTLYDDALRARTRVEGPNWARQFSLERMAQQYVDVYREAANSGSGKIGMGRRRRSWI